MSDFLNDKDYGDYFRQIEENLNSDKKKKDKQEQPKREEKEPAPKVHRHKSKKSFRLNKKAILAFVSVIIVAVIIFTVVISVKPKTQKDEFPKVNAGNINTSDKDSANRKNPKSDRNTAEPSSEIQSEFIAFMDINTHRLIAARNENKRAYPASTTKIMTALVACENIKDFNDTFEMTLEITDPIFKAEATAAGFKSGEIINMNDLLYGCILPSGGDAALGLAYKISGNEENFVKLMNKKAKELNLKDTHFTNCTGLFDKDHYTTASDMAVIVEAAMNNEICRKVLTTFQYTTSKTEQNPDGLLLSSTLFSNMYGNEPETATIDGGKTGYLNESGFCIASFGHSLTGKNYICVTLHSGKKWPAVFDQIELYKEFAK